MVTELALSVMVTFVPATKSFISGTTGMVGLLRISATPEVAFQSLFTCGAAVALITLFNMLILSPAVSVSCFDSKSVFVATTVVSIDISSFWISMPLPAV